MLTVQAATDLDTVIAAHNQYLETLLKKALLDDNVADRPGAAAQNDLQGHLHMILRHMLNLMGPVARLNEAVSAILAFITAWANQSNVRLLAACHNAADEQSQYVEQAAGL